MSNAMQRKGMIVTLEEQLDGIERDLKNIAAGIGDATLAIGSHLDTDGKQVLHLAQQYQSKQNEGIQIRKRIQELKES